MAARQKAGSRAVRTERRAFSRPVLGAIDTSGFLKIRAGTVHRFIGIWAVVVDGRVFVRSWNDKPEGWHRALTEERHGAIQIGLRTLRIRPRHVRGDRLLHAIEAAYAAKYRTPASRYYVRGFKTPRRRRSTTELLPA